MQYVIGNEIPMVGQYKHLWCVVDKHLELKNMVEDSAFAGQKVLGALFHRYRTEFGDIGVREFITSLIETNMLYGL